MSGVKVSELTNASALSITDLLYLVNSGNPRKLTLNDLILFFKAQTGLTVSVNGIASVNNAITLDKASLALGNVPNVNPVTSLNALSGAAVLVSDGSLVVSVSGQNISFKVNPEFTLDWSKLTGSWETQAQLAAALASVGVQLTPRTTSTTVVLSDDILRQWVNVDVAVETQMIVPSSMNAAIGALIEFRQIGQGAVTVTGDAISLVTQPVGSKYKTTGIGSRIQIVSLGGNAWEFK